MTALYATHDEALDRVELGVSGINSYGNLTGWELEAVKAEGSIYELCEWNDQDTDQAMACWVYRFADGQWDYVTPADAEALGLKI